MCDIKNFISCFFVFFSWAFCLYSRVFPFNDQFLFLELQTTFKIQIIYFEGTCHLAYVIIFIGSWCVRENPFLSYLYQSDGISFRVQAHYLDSNQTRNEYPEKLCNSFHIFWFYLNYLVLHFHKLHFILWKRIKTYNFNKFESPVVIVYFKYFKCHL